jgi:hypothetical protein
MQGDRIHPVTRTGAGQSIGFSPDTLLGVPAPRGLCFGIDEVNAVDGTQIQ